MISNVQHLPLYRSKAFLQKKYVEERLSANEIAALILSSRTAVLKHLRGYGIPLRTTEQGFKTKSQLGYGEVWRNRQVVEHKREAGLIKKMQTLKVEGLSYWKIADVLNAWGIPTKTRKGGWSAKTVHQVLKRTAQREVKPNPGFRDLA